MSGQPITSRRTPLGKGPGCPTAVGTSARQRSGRMRGSGRDECEAANVLWLATLLCLTAFGYDRPDLQMAATGTGRAPHPPPHRDERQLREGRCWTASGRRRPIHLRTGEAHPASRRGSGIPSQPKVRPPGYVPGSCAVHRWCHHGAGLSSRTSVRSRLCLPLLIAHCSHRHASCDGMPPLVHAGSAPDMRSFRIHPVQSSPVWPGRHARFGPDDGSPRRWGQSGQPTDSGYIVGARRCRLGLPARPSCPPPDLHSSPSGGAKPRQALRPVSKFEITDGRFARQCRPTTSSPKARAPTTKPSDCHRPWSLSNCRAEGLARVGHIE